MINRDFFKILQKFTAQQAVLLWGPRQVGKTTLLDLLPLKSKVFLDDLGARQRAQEDPALFFENIELPCLIDEAQYAPNLFPEIKKRIDKTRRDCLKAGTHPLAGLYYLTGSSPSLLDDHVKESLAGRCHIFNLHGLSVKEILKHFEVFPLKRVMLLGGFPELYMNSQLVPQQYLNDYIISFIEKDIARSSGIEKIAEFHTVLRLLAARSGQLISFSEVATLAGVDQKTVMWWAQLLQRNFILELVPAYSSNLSKRITKQKKLYFLDVGICSRLQGHQTEDQIWNSSQLGSLFETLVFSEIAKTKSNFLIDWQMYIWRTHDQAEVDFILHYKNSFIFIEAKVAIHGAKAFELDREAIKVFKGQSVQKIVVTAGGEITQLDQSTKAVPIQVLGDYLIKIIETM